MGSSSSTVLLNKIEKKTSVHNIMKFINKKNDENILILENNDWYKTIFNYVCCNKPQLILPLLDSKYLNQKIFNMVSNIDGYSCLHFVCHYNSYYIEQLLTSKHLTSDLFYHVDSKNNTILHAIFKEHVPQIEKLELLINYYLMDNYIFSQKNSKGQTCLHLATLLSERSEINDCIVALVNNRFMTAELFSSQDNKGLTALHNLCHCNTSLVFDFLNCDFMNHKMFSSVNKNGKTCFHIICKYNPEDYFLILNSKYMTREVFEKRDNNGNTAIHYLFKSITTYEQYNDIMTSKFMTPDHIYFKNNDGKTIFNILNDYNKEFYDYLLKKEFVNNTSRKLMK